MVTKEQKEVLGVIADFISTYCTDFDEYVSEVYNDGDTDKELPFNADDATEWLRYFQGE